MKVKTYIVLKPFSSSLGNKKPGDMISYYEDAAAYWVRAGLVEEAGETKPQPVPDLETKPTPKRSKKKADK